MKLLETFFLGTSYLGRGCKTFFLNWRMWKYSILPLLVVGMLYVLLFWGSAMLLLGAASYAEPWLEKLPSCLMWLKACITCAWYLTGGLLMLVLAAVSLGMLYELCGGIFFDLLVEHFEKKEYGHLPNPFQLRFTLLTWLDATAWAVRSLFFFLLCLLLNFLIPFIGPVLMAVILGYHYGISALLCTSFYHGERKKVLLQKTAKKRTLILGFGIPAYFLFLFFPILSIFFLPGMILGGTMLYHEQIISDHS